MAPAPHRHALSAAQLHQVLREWNDPAPPGDPGGLLPELLAVQAARQPRAAALLCGQDEVSRGRLEQWAAALAARLRERGAGPEVVVGMLLERSPAAVAAVMAIWKAGAAYLPLDPESPDERLAFLLRDGLRPPAPRLVVTCAAFAGKAAGRGVEVLLVDEPERAGRAAGARPAAPLLGDHAAYVIYTSGSTGTPKGIVVSHRSLTRRLLWASTVEMAPGDVVLHKTSLGFDVSLVEMFAPLLAGCRCVLAGPGVHRDPAQLAELIARHGITYASFPPSTLSLLLDLPQAPRLLASLRTLVTGGETVPPELVRRARALLPAVLFNRYGPTETTISVVTGACGEVGAGESVPLGRPIAGARVYVLDERLRPRPPLQAGEIYIGGPCVARGYLGRPELTAGSFVPDPFGSAGGERLYRTGDRGRWRWEGTLEFFGRADRQVKVRGVRIELEEVELALLAHPAIREAAVVAPRETATDSRRLVAYLVAEPGAALEVAEVRRFLARRLAGPMIPTAFARLAALPRTLSGKVDTAALPPPAAAGDVPPDAAAGAPRSAVERTLAAVFAELLELPRVGREQTLSELGGHSLLLVRLQARLARSLGAELDLAEIARHPSVAALAALIAGRAGATGAASGQPSAGRARSARTGAGHGRIRQPRATPAATARLLADAVLEPDLRWDAPPPALPPESVLLTGATGFLGAHLAAELLAQTPARVLCLVRSTGVAQGRAALRRALERYGLWRDEAASRLEPLSGDLARPLLGLSAADFRQLGDTVDAIYHCGAQVNFLYPYEALRAANVEATRELLRLAAAGRAKAVHHVSTLAVLPRPRRPGNPALPEAPLGERPAGIEAGYDQSKWVAEKLVEEARRRGAPAAIYRPGWLVGASRTALGNPSDLLTRLAVASLASGTAPELGEIRVCPTPVDFASAAMVFLSLRGGSLKPPGGIFHLVNPRRVAVDQLRRWLAELGRPLRVRPIRAWAKTLADQAAADPADPLSPFADLLRRLAGEAAADRPGRFAPPRFGTARTRSALASGPIRCAAIDRRFVAAWLAALAATDLLPPSIDGPPGRRAERCGSQP